MANYSDGTVNHGDIAVTLSTAGSVIIENWTTSRPSRNVRQYNENGEPLKQKHFDDFVDATGTVQIPASGTKPARYETFTWNGENWFITSVGEALSSTDYHKSNITAAKKYN